MNCEQSRLQMIDILYSEEEDPRSIFDFFRHVADCRECGREYRELVETREMLSEWKVQPPAGSPLDGPLGESWHSRWRGRSFRMWPLFQRVAAAFLILMGAVAILQSAGVWPDQRVAVSEQQLTEMIHDLMVARQVEDWRMIGAALLELKEDMENRHRADVGNMYEAMDVLEERYVSALEESNRNVKALLIR